MWQEKIQALSIERRRRFVITGASSLLLISILLSLLVSHQSPSSKRYKIAGALSLEEDDFVRQWLNVTVGDPQDGYTLDQLCNRRDVTWRKNLILNVHDANGGIGNIRGNVLDFLYFAIATGSSILLPTFAARSKSDISALFDGRTPFENFFDEHHFVSSLRHSCPNLHIYASSGEQAMTAHPEQYIARTMRTDLNDIDTSDASVNSFLNWLQEQDITDPPTNPTLINLGRTLWDGPDTLSFSSKMRRDFGSLLRLNHTARRLAATVAYNLAQRYNVDLVPSQPLHSNAYFGAHLRTESDAANAGWLTSTHGNFSTQTDAYLAQARSRKLKVIYAASGSREDLALFADKAWATDRVNVTHKHDLLSSTDLAELKGLSWDQQALVDYEVLLRSSYFGGFVRSSFSYNLAIARAAFLEMEGRVTSQRWWEVQPEKLDGYEQAAFMDRASVVWGRDDWHERKIPRGAWP